MDERWGEEKKIYDYKEENIEYEEEEDDDEDEEEVLKEKKRVMKSYKKKGSKAGGSVLPCCQVDNCNADLSVAKQYHKRHKVCEHHAKAHSVLIQDLQQRFCQQCSRFHEVSEFDELKRSCRRRLAGHNERRRKNVSEYHGEGFNR